MSTDRDHMLGKVVQGTPMWCMQCEKTYPHGKFRTAFDSMGEELMQMCPYEDCDSDAVLNSKEWSWVIGYHPEYPEKPEEGVIYPLH